MRVSPLANRPSSLSTNRTTRPCRVRDNSCQLRVKRFPFPRNNLQLRLIVRSRWLEEQQAVYTSASQCAYCPAIGKRAIISGFAFVRLRTNSSFGRVSIVDVEHVRTCRRHLMFENAGLSIRRKIQTKAAHLRSPAFENPQKNWSHMEKCRGIGEPHLANVPHNSFLVLTRCVNHPS